MNDHQVNTKRYMELLRKEKELDSLKENGLDNWSGYSEAMDSIDNSK